VKLIYHKISNRAVEYCAIIISFLTQFNKVFSCLGDLQEKKKKSVLMSGNVTYENSLSCHYDNTCITAG